MKKIIFDFGFNAGQNFEYFLLKADYVVGVEANEFLFGDIKKRFKKFIDEGRLHLENYALVDNEKIKSTKFFIADDSGHSTLLPKLSVSKKFNEVLVKCVTPKEIIKKYLKKFSLNEIEYIKIDLENYDHKILKNINDNKIFSKFMSVECHHPNTINQILRSDYKSFKFVKGSRKHRQLKILDKENNYNTLNFTNSSSGPYGDDIPGMYFTKNSIIPYFLNHGLGWIDVHCALDKKDFKKDIIYNEEIHINPGIFKQISNLFINIIKFAKKKFLGH